MNIDTDTLLIQLANLPNTPMRRRLSYEITNMNNESDNNKLYIQSIYADDDRKVNVTLVDSSIEENMIVYDFVVSDNYPFNPPKIKVNGSDYYNFLSIKSENFRSILKTLYGVSCLCCNSFLCGDRWTPAIRLSGIVVEIRLYRKYKRDILNKYFTDKIKFLYLIDDIDLFSWLF
jgi:ubiquitin-protein ligase